MNEQAIRMRQKATARVQRMQLHMIPQTFQGAGCLNQVPLLLTRRRIKRVLVVTTPGFAKRPILEPFFLSLKTRDIRATVFSEVVPDPTFECAQKAASCFRREDCQAIIAIGGGSAIDCAKIAGVLAVRPHALATDLAGTMKVKHRTPFLIAVPTTAGTGSEVTAAAVLADPETQRKYAISDFALIPNVAVLDPQLLLELPAALTAYSGMDALTHAVEAFTNRYGSQEARDRALGAVVAVFRSLKTSYDEPGNLEARMQMLQASYDAGIAFTNAFVGYTHALAHAVGGRYHTPHGKANAVLLPLVMEQFGATAERDLALLARAVGLTGSSNAQLAQAFIDSIRQLNASLGIDASLPEIEPADIPQLAAVAEAEGNPSYPVPQIWDRSVFEQVLVRASGQADAQSVHSDASPASQAEGESAPGVGLESGGAGRTVVKVGVGVVSVVILALGAQALRDRLSHRRRG